MGGDLPCSKEEAATLAGIQLHLDETWPEEECDTAPPSATGSVCPSGEGAERDHLLKDGTGSQPARPRKKEFSVANRTKKFASNRRRGKLTKHLVCLDDDSQWLQCLRGTDARMATCLPPSFCNSSKVKDLIEVCI